MIGYKLTYAPVLYISILFPVRAAMFSYRLLLFYLGLLTNSFSQYNAICISSFAFFLSTHDTCIMYTIYIYIYIRITTC